MKIIDAEELIAKAQHEAEGMTEPFKSNFAVLVEWLIDKVQPIEPKPQWIPCSERLPENRLYVLVTYKYEYGLIDHGITWYGQAEEKWDTSREVIAWMPLPKPWEGEEAE